MLRVWEDPTIYWLVKGERQVEVIIIQRLQGERVLVQALSGKPFDSGGWWGGEQSQATVWADALILTGRKVSGGYYGG